MCGAKKTIPLVLLFIMSSTVLYRCIENLVPTILTMQFSLIRATYHKSDISGGNISDIMKPPLEPQNTLQYFILLICSCTPQDL